MYVIRPLLYHVFMVLYNVRKGVWMWFVVRRRGITWRSVKFIPLANEIMSLFGESM